ncbi:MAG: hypothetical protein JO318_07605 [Chloroflexi bacterium]|nr:hypothetical protein [Chloroflexota bacterium]
MREFALYQLARWLQSRAPAAAAAVEDPDSPDSWPGLNYVHDRMLDKMMRDEAELWG